MTTAMMRVAAARSYGPPSVVAVEERPVPRPAKDEALVRVAAASVSSGDARIRAARFPRGMSTPARLVLGIRRPRRPVLGSAFAGTVTAVGSRVSGLEVGEEVAGMMGARLGAHAEYVAVPAARVVRVPAGVSPERAAAVLFGGTTALHFLRDLGGVGPGDRVLVVGASGSVGTHAVQLAVSLGAHVTAVASPDNLDLARRFGAADVVDRTVIDPTTLPAEYDVVLDTVGALTPATGRPLLAESGRLLLVVATLADTLRARGQVKAGVAPERSADFEHLLGLVAAGTLEPVIHQVLPLEQIVRAHEIVDSGRKVGDVLVRP